MSYNTFLNAQRRDGNENETVVVELNGPGPEWKQTSSRQYQRGYFNFYHEVPAMREFLDIGHTKHCVDAKVVDTSMLDVRGSLRGGQTQDELDAVVQKVWNHQALLNPNKQFCTPFGTNQMPAKYKKNKSESFTHRMELDNCNRELRHVFFEQWEGSRVKCAQHRYISQVEKNKVTGKTKTKPMKKKKVNPSQQRNTAPRMSAFPCLDAETPAEVAPVPAQRKSAFPCLDQSPVERPTESSAWTPLNLNPEIEVSSSDSSEEEVEELVPVPQPTTKKQPFARKSVCAEVFGRFNLKENFVPNVITKTESIKQSIRERLSNVFMFADLNQDDLDIVIDAMDQSSYKPGDTVIREGDKGDVLFVVEKGSLDCFKVLPGDSQPTLLKSYQPGEVFGELALLYDAPRAATIKAKTSCQVWELDRQTFNHIVKDAAQKKREKYEEFLSKVEIFKSMSEYERSKIADSIKEQVFSEGQTVIAQGQAGDTFYIVIQGEAQANRSRQTATGLSNKYKPGQYFGELALLNQQNSRAATIKANTFLKVATIERESFGRLLGPLEDILKRNINNYQ